MTWRGATTQQERILSCLPYLVTLLDCLPFGLFLFAKFPPLVWIFRPLFWIAPLYFWGSGGIAIVPLLVFLALYMGVVRNTQLRHLIRFNAMQAILLGFALAIISLLLSLVGIVRQGLVPSDANLNLAFDGSLFVMLLFDLLFSGTVALVIYSVVQSLRGKHPEIPIISNAAYAQTQD
ncbi:MAG: hypothetical protein HC934_08620 [Acaryochloridaceae cyanobacterium SU_2_1]|nr:hypothetical protein [Acaryochloridaceae cyanobacterium SU_2_1]